MTPTWTVRPGSNLRTVRPGSNLGVNGPSHLICHLYICKHQMRHDSCSNTDKHPTVKFSTAVLCSLLLKPKGSDIVPGISYMGPRISHRHSSRLLRNLTWEVKDRSSQGTTVTIRRASAVCFGLWRENLI